MSDHPAQTAHPGPGLREPTPPGTVAWSLLWIPAVVQFLLHILTNGNYGIFRDEYYYLACAARPDWGYVDHPPLSIWVLAVWKSLFGDTVHALRVLPALCGSVLVVLTGMLAAQLGGWRWAQLLAGLAVAVGAAGLVMCGFYSMNAFDLLFWTGAYYLVAHIARTGDGRWWPLLGLLLGIGLMNKIGLLVFGVALVAGLLATGHRKQFLERRLWLAGILALIFLAPYVLWNAANDWPTREFIQNAKAYKISDISPLDFLNENMLEANPMTLPLWLGGLVWLLVARGAGRFRLLGLMFMVTFVAMVVQKSKPYYLAASFPVLMAAGGVAWEGWTHARRWRWVRWLLVAILVLGGAVYLPMALPLLPLEDSVAYQQRLGIVPNTGEVGHTSAAPQYFSDRFGWQELAQKVSEVFAELPDSDRKRCVVLASNYGQAGALEYWARLYDLPPVASRHNNYWLWGPPEDAGAVVIGIGFGRETLEREFSEIETAGVSADSRALESRIPIWICRGLRRPLGNVWDELKLFI